jgi:O-acetyl-ADP-ribose deacetylase (regulator of RNase III)
MTIEIKTADLLQATEEAIVHQCNCVSKGSAGLARSLFQKYPWADIYRNRFSPSIPGTIRIVPAPDREVKWSCRLKVIALFGQYAPGAPSRETYMSDSSSDRERFFQNCLKWLSETNVSSLAFPYGIGCGLAGGHWPTYQAMLEQFAKDNPTKKIVLYKLERQS